MRGGWGAREYEQSLPNAYTESPARRLNSLANEMLTVALHKFVATKEAVLAQENLHTILSAEYKRAPLPTGVYMRTSMSWGGRGWGRGGGCISIGPEHERRVFNDHIEVQ